MCLFSHSLCIGTRLWSILIFRILSKFSNDDELLAINEWSFKIEIYLSKHHHYH
jgi:hypothetical protein